MDEKNKPVIMNIDTPPITKRGTNIPFNTVEDGKKGVDVAFGTSVFTKKGYEVEFRTLGNPKTI